MGPGGLARLSWPSAGGAGQALGRGARTAPSCRTAGESDGEAAAATLRIFLDAMGQAVTFTGLFCAGQVSGHIYQ